jgi:shikimate dehydrogenase
MDHPCLKLGLLGANISRSLAPRLHRLLGAVHGLRVTYDLMDAAALAYEPAARARGCAQEGYAGLNITHPFKRAVLPHVRVADARCACTGSVNTLRLGTAPWEATNTDYTGFLRAYRHRFGSATPGGVVILGAGGVGRSVAFALAELGAERLAIHDLDGAAAAELAAAVRACGVPVEAIGADAVPDAARAATGLVNCTPVGMFHHPGNPLPPGLLGGQEWAFDAVYTPVWTPFLTAAREAGLAALSGFELFLFQGLDAFTFFTGLQTPPEAVRSVAESWLPPAAP